MVHCCFPVLILLTVFNSKFWRMVFKKWILSIYGLTKGALAVNIRSTDRHASSTDYATPVAVHSEEKDLTVL